MQEKEYTWCFACGKDNPIGLKMEFTMDAEECVAYFTPRQEHQSYDGRIDRKSTRLNSSHAT